MHRFAWIAAGLLLLSGTAAAQCPAGQPNTPGCIPPDAPGWRHNQQAPAQPAPSAPSKMRFESHGAFAYDAQTKSVGVSTDRYMHGTQAKAEEVALASCRKNGGGEGCRVVAHFKNGCAAMMIGLSPGQEPVVHVGKSFFREGAQEETEKLCKKKSEVCQPVWADCVMSVSL